MAEGLIMRHVLASALAIAAIGLTRPAMAGPAFLGLFHLPDRAITWSEAVQVLGQGDVVFIGEQHNDPETHRVELAALQALAESGGRVALSMEMFESDVQPALDAYLAGSLDEAAFLAQSRPWPNYKTDYRPLVEFAKAKGLPVIAANVPRPLAALVAKEGFEGLRSLPWAQARHAAVPDKVDPGAPWTRFQGVMGAHAGASLDSLWRMYEAQSLKDATMARSIGTALATRSPGWQVLHVQGRFHSDYGAGVPAYLRQLMPNRPLRVMTVLPVASAAAVSLKEATGLADVVGFVQAVPTGD
jgi:uncharacterized iron-regulated protein